MTPEAQAAILDGLAEDFRGDLADIEDHADDCPETWAEWSATAEALEAGAAALRRGTCATCACFQPRHPAGHRCTMHGHLVVAEDFCSEHVPLPAPPEASPEGR